MATALRSFLDKYPRLRLFHFTDTRNLPSIRTHGILSRKVMKDIGVRPVAFGGDDLSQGLDDLAGFDEYVHLCLFDDHPVAYKARKDGRLLIVRYLPISKNVLGSDGVLFCAGVSIKKEMTTVSFQKAMGDVDFSIAEEAFDWGDLCSRQARLWEILVPSRIRLDLVRNLR